MREWHGIAWPVHPAPNLFPGGDSAGRPGRAARLRGGHHDQQRDQRGPGAESGQRHRDTGRGVRHVPGGRAHRRGGLPVPAQPEQPGRVPGGDRGHRQGRAGLRRRDELRRHHRHRGLRGGQGGQQPGQRTQPAPDPAQRGQGAGPQPAGRPGRLQPGHHDPVQAVPDPDRERDGQLPADPGRRADRHRPGQGAALAGGSAAVRDAGHSTGSRRRTGSRLPTWPRPGRADVAYATTS